MQPPDFPISIQVEKPDQRLLSSAEQLLAVAQSYRIDSPEVYEAAATDLQEIKGKLKALEEKRVAITKPLNQAIKAVNDLFRKPKELLEQAEALIKKAMSAYDQEQERKRREEQARLEEEARKERERLEAKAREAEEKGQIEKAEALRESANAVVAPIVSPATEAPKVTGIATRGLWKARVTDKAALVRHIVAERPDLLFLIEIDSAALNALARAQKSALSLPGVEVYEEKVIAVRAS
ncbi:MAG: hypothetical protein KatS3mg082_1762 [Nitrospiraceae bacterium]|nr:MAG: hypothetical protein KatS3mg082_1762 [Nitrospiraceae bacterium]